MQSRLNPYIHFDGNAREAMEFYQEALGGDLALNTFGEAGADDPALTRQIMHGMLETNGMTLMASDSPPGVTHTAGNNMAVSLSGDNADELRGYWAALIAGGAVTVPLERQVWGDEFGMCEDKFGINWMVNITVATS